MDGKKVLIGAGIAVAVVVVIIIAVVSGGGNNGGSGLASGGGDTSSSVSEGSGSNPLAPSPTPTAGGNPEDVYPDGYVPDWIDPERDHGDEGHEHGDDDNADFSDDEHTLPPGTFGDWTPTAEAFAQSFADTTVGKDNWLIAMRPYISNTLYDTLSKGDPVSAKLDYHGVTLVKDNNGGRVDAVINYGPQSLLISLLQTGDAWYVDNITGYNR